MALSDVEIQTIINGLVDYKFIILAALLGEGRIQHWLNSITDDGIKEEIQLAITEMDTALQHKFAELDTPAAGAAASADASMSVKDQFYQLMVGVPLSMIDPQHQTPGLARQATGMPKPGLYATRGPIDQHAGCAYNALHESTVERPAKLAIVKFLRDNDSIAKMLLERLSVLQLASNSFNEHTKQEIDRLRQAMLVSRRELAGTTSPEGGDTQPLSSNSSTEATQPEEDESEGAAAAAMPALQKFHTTPAATYPAMFLATRPASCPVAPTATQPGELEAFHASLERTASELTAPAARS